MWLPMIKRKIGKGEIEFCHVIIKFVLSVEKTGVHNTISIL